MDIFTDAQAAQGFVLEQGRNVEASVFEKRYPTYNYADVVPVVTEGNPWAIGTQFFTVDTTGEAKVISGAANDLPFVSATQDTGSHDFWMIGAGWEWTLEEVNQASLYRTNLNATKAVSAGDAVERLLYNTAMTGETIKNATGFVNASGVTATDVAASGSGSSKFWTAKTGDLMVDDVNDLLSTVRESTGEVEYADTVALPPAAFRLLATTRVDTDKNKSALTLLQESNIYTAETGQPLKIVQCRALTTASGDSGGRMVAYRYDPEVVRFHLPMVKTMLPPRQKGLMAWESGVYARTGGVEVRLPGAMAYGDEILAP